MLMTFLCVICSLSHLFLNFESAVVLGVPLGSLFLSVLLFFVMKIFSLRSVKYLLNQVSFHFYQLFFPSSWFMLVLFFFIMFMNVFGLVPGTFSLSSLPLMTLSMSIVSWAGSYIYCFYHNYSSCVSHFLPQSSPMALGILLVWIEILSWICRPLALSIRLMANITAGHLLMFLCSSSVFFSSSVFLIPMIFLFGLVSLEIGVSFIQSYVYQLLLSLYMSEGLS